MASLLVRTNLCLTARSRVELAKQAKKQGTSAADIIRRVLDAYLGIEPEPVAPIIFKNQLPMRHTAKGLSTK
jgi:hypothetical protein